MHVSWRQVFLTCALLAWPMTGYAQEATITGTVTDATGGVLPGVVLTALHETTGTTFEAVTDDSGNYRIPARVGTFRITATLPGFAEITSTGITLLVGQVREVDLEMKPSALAETVTVTGDAPLVNTTGSQLGGNVDALQVSELPVNGRNFMNLTLLAPGSRANAVNEGPVDRETGGSFHLNVDGQQVSVQVAGSGFGEPRYSRDAVAEFEFISNRFDATQGRSTGVQVNVVSKSGTNVFAGSLGGYFRDDKFTAADFVARRVLPYSTQQVSTTFGGPILKDKTHFFVNYEYEHEPLTFSYNSPFPRFNFDVNSDRAEHKSGLRLDHAFSPRTRLMVRGNTWQNRLPWDPRWTGGAILHPSGSARTDRDMLQFFTSLTQVLGNRAANDLKVGYASFAWGSKNVVEKGVNIPGVGNTMRSISLRGYTIGPSNRYFPQDIGHENYSVRDEFTYSFDWGGSHTLKTGGEYIHMNIWFNMCDNCGGLIDAQVGNIPANIEDLFPVWNDVSTWDLAALSPITRVYRINVGDFRTHNPRDVYAGWAQDDWQLTERLTLNLGVRYDLQHGVFAETEKRSLLPFLPANRPSDKNNVAPRLGFAFRLGDNAVVRGGYGRYYGDLSTVSVYFAKSFLQQVSLQIPNDGRPNFAADPFNGRPAPTLEEALLGACDVSPSPTCFLRGSFSGLPNPRQTLPYSDQVSLGFQRQVGPTMALTADYVYTGSRNEEFSRNINLTYNPATGANYSFQDANRPWPEFGVISQSNGGGWSNLHALQASFTKQFSNRWQGSATYTLSGFWDAIPVPGLGVLQDQKLPFPVAKDIGGEYGLAVGDQRHRAVFNGIWQVGRGFQVSGLYQFGSGQRFATTYGGDLRNQGTAASSRLRPDGTIVPRNNFVGRPVHRVDLRLLQRIPVFGRVTADGMLEVFNLFNHENFGSYVTQEALGNFGTPTRNSNIAYQPRMLQLGFRVAF